MPLLVHIPYSPWSDLARTALRIHGVAHDRRVYTSTLSEPWLRWQLGRWSGPVTVPVLLVDDGPPILDSLGIARWAAARSATPWLTPEDDALVARCNAIVMDTLAAGRLRTTASVLTDPAALEEALPPFLQGTGPLGQWIARDAARRLLRKYGGDDGDAAVWTVRLARGLDALEDLVGDGPWVLDRCTWADVLVATGLAFVAPRDDAPLGPALRPHWCAEALAADHPRLLAHRDRTWEAVGRALSGSVRSVDPASV